jgi:hypothetical protein
VLVNVGGASGMVDMLIGKHGRFVP